MSEMFGVCGITTVMAGGTMIGTLRAGSGMLAKWAVIALMVLAGFVVVASMIH